MQEKDTSKGKEEEKMVTEEEEVKKRVGRPRKVEELAKERRGSTGCLDDFLKRKREGGGEMEGEGEERLLRRSKKTERLGELWPEKEELRKMIGEMGEMIMERMREEVGGLKLELWRKEGEWREEKKVMKERMEKLEGRVAEVEEKMRGGGNARIINEAGREEGYKILGEEMAGKMKDIGRKMEMKEREERKNNIVIRNMEEEKGELKERVEKLIEGIGAKVEIEWIRKIRGREGGRGEMVVARLGNREQKGQVMRRKSELKGRKVRIEDDLTWEERKMRWKITEIAEKERRRGNRVWTGHGKIRINEKWWGWDEKEGCLKDWNGEQRKEEKEEEKGEGN